MKKRLSFYASEALNYQGVYQLAQQDQNAGAIQELQSISSPPYETYDGSGRADIPVGTFGEQGCSPVRASIS